MSFIISLQGGMASGKTTLAKHLDSILNGVKVSFENSAETINKIRRLGLNKYQLEDYLKIQRLFIQTEIERYNKLIQFDKVILDLGPDEIEFYTLHFPRSINKNWDIETLLKDELHELRQCSIDGILYLDASTDTLSSRKENDKSRNRNFFNHYIKHLHPHKKEWFKNIEYSKILDTDILTKPEIETTAVNWLNRFDLTAQETSNTK